MTLDLLLVALTVIVIGVEQGIVLAIVGSIVAHLRRSYNSPTAVMRPSTDGRGWHGVPATPELRSAPGLVVLRFAGSICYANANHLSGRALSFAGAAVTEPLSWLCLDAAMVPDADFTGAQMLRELQDELRLRGVRLVVAEAIGSVRASLDRHGLATLLGENAIFPTVRAACSRTTRSVRPRRDEEATGLTSSG